MCDYLFRRRALHANTGGIALLTRTTITKGRPEASPPGAGLRLEAHPLELELPVVLEEVLHGLGLGPVWD